jgi:hypothetical protein
MMLASMDVVTELDVVGNVNEAWIVGQEDGGRRKGDANTKMVTETVYPIEKRNGEINVLFPNSWGGTVIDVNDRCQMKRKINLRELIVVN